MYWLRCLGMIRMMLVYSAIAGILVSPTQAAQTPPAAEAVPAAEATQAQRTELEKRVAGKWEALVHKDFEAAYSFTSPSYRKLYSLNTFKGRFGGNVNWQRIEAVKIDFKGSDAAIVSFDLHFVYYPQQAEKPLSMKTHIQESWVRADGQWWYVVED